MLLHGLGRSALSMWSIENALERKGYRVWNKSYASTEKVIPKLIETSIVPAVHYCGGLKQTSFVTHSMGGILVRGYLQNKPFNGRIVMIAPPNHGSELPDNLREWALFRKILGPAGLQLGATSDSYPNSLDAIEGEIGIITGNRSIEPWFSTMLPGEDDGKVSTQSAQLSEMKDFLVVPYGHTFVMNKAPVIEQVSHFLRNGEFRKKSKPD